MSVFRWPCLKKQLVLLPLTHIDIYTFLKHSNVIVIATVSSIMSTWERKTFSSSAFFFFRNSLIFLAVFS